MRGPPRSRGACGVEVVCARSREADVLDPAVVKVVEGAELEQADVLGEDEEEGWWGGEEEQGRRRGGVRRGVDGRALIMMHMGGRAGGRRAGHYSLSTALSLSLSLTHSHGTTSLVTNETLAPLTPFFGASS